MQGLRDLPGWSVLICVVRDWDDLVQLIESKLNRVSSVFLQPISKWSIFLSNSHIRHPFSS